ncbi:MAG: hypothetical protein ACRDOP_10150, partial [Gaiellaceae bacterium]
ARTRPSCWRTPPARRVGASGLSARSCRARGQLLLLDDGEEAVVHAAISFPLKHKKKYGNETSLARSSNTTARVNTSFSIS